MRADLRHEEDPLRRPIRERLPIAISLSPSWYSQALSMNVMPASIARVHDLDGLADRRHEAEVIAAEAERRHALAGMTAEGREEEWTCGRSAALDCYRGLCHTARPTKNGPSRSR